MPKLTKFHLTVVFTLQTFYTANLETKALFESFHLSLQNNI